MSVNKVNSDGSLLRVAGGTLYADSPIGTISPFGGSAVPSGYLLCDGAEVLKTTYAELYAVIGDAFGTASVNTKFVLPDLRESVPKGAGLTGHTVGNHLDADGLAVGEFLDDQIQNIGKMKAQTTSGYSLQAGGIAGYIIAKSDLRTGVTTEVKSVGVNYIIKAKQVAVPADFLAKVEEVMAEDMYYQTGIVNLPTGNAGDVDLSVTFDTPMPDNEYVVALNFGSQNLHAFTLMPGNLSTTGFVISGKRTTAVASELYVRWKAFRIPH